MTLDLVWVIVCYGTPNEAAILARRVRALANVRVIVGCNLAGDADHLRALCPPEEQVSVVDASHNPGYIGALREMLPGISSESTIVLSNTDIEIDDDFFPAVTEAMSLYPGAGVLAPSILQSGHDQNPHLLHPPSRRKLTLLRVVYRFPLLADALLLRKRGHAARQAPASMAGATIYAAHGSCFVLTPKFFQRGATLDYPCFLFGEELWIGSEARRVGAEIRYVPAARLVHRGGSSTGRRRRGMVAWAKYESVRFWARAANTGAFQNGIYRPGVGK